MVVDEDRGTVLGEVTGIQGAHGTALAEATGHGFATSGNDRFVVMFDLKTFKALGRIPAAEDADAIIYNSASNRVFTFNGDAHSSPEIDPRAGTLITNIPLGGKPEYCASAGDGFASNADGTLTVIHQDTPDQYHVIENVQTPQGARNMGLDPTNHRRFIVSAKFGPAPSGAAGLARASEDKKDGSDRDNWVWNRGRT